MKIDMNSDIGESFGIYKIGNDANVLDFVTSCNIACGFHAGDPNVMDQTIALAKERNVAIGAHPGLPDLIGFGRRNMDISPDEAFRLTLYQLGAIAAFCKVHKVKLQHVKPHGALYNMAAKDYKLASSIAKAIKAFDSSLILLGLAGSKLIEAGNDIGIKTASEVFADRSYQEDGTLTPRNHKDALITDVKTASERIIRMLSEHKVKTVTGADIPIKADSICIHGDSEFALDFAKQIKEQIAAKDITLLPMGEFL